MSTEKQKTMGEILKEIRERAGFAQGELAKKMGYSSPQFVSNWERNLCSLPPGKASLFCQLTGMSPSTMKNLLMREAKRKIEKGFKVHKKKIAAVEAK